MGGCKYQKLKCKSQRKIEQIQSIAPILALVTLAMMASEILQKMNEEERSNRGAEIKVYTAGGGMEAAR